MLYLSKIGNGKEKYILYVIYSKEESKDEIVTRFKLIQK
jgi:hypothetical protein